MSKKTPPISKAASLLGDKAFELAEKLKNSPKMEWLNNLEAPNQNLLMEWALKLDPIEARTDPKSVIFKVIKLYVEAADASLNFSKGYFLIKKAYETCKTWKIASLHDEEDTFRPWLEKNATDERDKIKTGDSLLKAIELFVEMGVVKVKPSHGAWYPEKLLVEDADYDDEGHVIRYYISESQMNTFLELRRINRQKGELQKDYQKYLKAKSAVEEAESPLHALVKKQAVKKNRFPG